MGEFGALMLFTALFMMAFLQDGARCKSCLDQWLIVISRVRATSVFDTMNLYHRIVPVECTRESVRTDSEFRERATGQWFEELIGVTPF